MPGGEGGALHLKIDDMKQNWELIQNRRNGGSWRVRMLFPAALMATILLGSSGGAPSAPGFMLFPHVDKLVHFLVFGLVATAVYRAFPPWVRSRKRFIGAILITMLFGIVDETRQGFNPERQMDLVDWIADFSGALVAVTVYTYWPFYRSLLEFRFVPSKLFHGVRPSSQTRAGIAPADRPAR